MCRLVLVLVAWVGVSVALIGEPGPPKEATPEIQRIVDHLKSDINADLGLDQGTDLEAVSYNIVVVNGVLYFIKVRTQENEYYRVRIYQNFRGTTSFQSAQPSSAMAPYTYFE